MFISFSYICREVKVFVLWLVLSDEKESETLTLRPLSCGSEDRCSMSIPLKYSINRKCVNCKEKRNWQDDTFCECEYRLRELGMEKGWGNTAGRVLEMIHLLLDLLQAPDPDTLEKFLARIPMVFSVAILSPHGYFGQADVLGMPDTGGQVS